MSAQLGPLIVGTLAILGLSAYVTVEDPAPGQLGHGHGALTQLNRLANCDVCHSEEGLTAGCLGCHTEIRAEREKAEGYHGLHGGECAECHKEHLGEDFDVRWNGEDPEQFQHTHVPYILEGGHDALKCDECHKKATFALPDFPTRQRETTYLGLTQECLDCHGDVHEGGRFTRCTACHDQKVFKPAVRFDHDRLFPLNGGHDNVACLGCHIDFDDTYGTTCAECHVDPHRMPGTESCEDCHRGEDPKWTDATMTVEEHAQTGFPLDAAHAKVECDKCHVPGESNAERFPGRTPDDCQACHADAHDGQFPGRTCAECHSGDAFKPATYTREDHVTFPLRNAHGKTDCEKCHKADPVTTVTEYAGITAQCRACHEDVHRGQFAEDCDSCHNDTAFAPALYDKSRHEFPLRNGHGDVLCKACHKPESDTGVQQFATTSRRCRTCHEDVHKGQFPTRDCDVCHDDRAFLPASYDVATHTRFRLEGAHRAVSCRACHKQDQTGLRRFDDVTQKCQDCHDNPHGTQFRKELKGKDCTACHREDARTFRIQPYDHARRTGYALKGAHRTVACAACHRPDAAGVDRYRPTPKKCASCHTDVHRGQFRKKGVTNCERCHKSADAWDDMNFDHSRTRFQLDKAHANVACDRCHPTVKQPDGERVVQYRPLGTECGDCHDFRKR